MQQNISLFNCININILSDSLFEIQALQNDKEGSN